MISQDTIIERLTGQVGAKFKGFGKASDLIDALNGFTGGPIAYVMPSARRPGPETSGTQFTRQRVAHTYQVLIGFSRDGDRFDEMDKAGDDVIDALLGWQPPGETGVMTYSGGGLVPVDLNAGVIFWSESFTINKQLRSI